MVSNRKVAVLDFYSDICNTDAALRVYSETCAFKKSVRFLGKAMKCCLASHRPSEAISAFDSFAGHPTGKAKTLLLKAYKMVGDVAHYHKVLRLI